MPKIILNTPYPTLDEVARWAGLTAKRRAELEQLVQNPKAAPAKAHGARRRVKPQAPAASR